MFDVPSALKLADLFRVTVPLKVPLPEVMLLPIVVTPVPELATVTLRPMVTFAAPIRKEGLFEPVLAALIVTVLVALPSAPDAPLVALAPTTRLPELSVVVPV